MTYEADRGLIKQNASGSLTPPKAIFTNANAARAVYEQYRSAHIKRIVLYAEIEGLIGGNPPYDPVELHEAKIEFITNYNNLDARALYERSGQAYWNLLNQAEHLAVVSLAQDSPEATEIQEVIAEEFSRMLRSCKSFASQLNQATSQLVKLGVSPIFWPDERDWRFRTVDMARFYVQDQCPSDLEQVTMIFMDSEQTAQWLMQVYEAFKDKPKAESPWNIEVLGQLLLFQANQWCKLNGISTQYTNWVDVQRMITNGDFLGSQIFTDEISLVSAYVREYSGKISHYMFSRNVPEAREFLFSSLEQYSCFDEALVIFTACPGETTIHGNRGVGHKIFAPCQASMQLECSMMDTAKFASTPLLASSPNGPQSADPIRWNPGVPTHIGTSQFVQNTLGVNLVPIINVAQYINGKLNYNIANSGDDPGLPDKEQGSISDSQARRRSVSEFNVLKCNVNHFYESGADVMYKNIYIKVLKSKEGYPGYEYVEDFKERCKRRGVPDEFFSIRESDKKYFRLPPTYNEVKATRVAGDGSQLATIMGLESLAPFVPSWGPREQKQYNRELVKAHMGVDYVKIFQNKEDDADSMAGGASVAQLENSVMKMGESAQFSPDNDQRAHIAIHFALATNTIQQVQQQQIGNLDADKIFQQLIPHTKEHVDYVAQDPLNQPFFESIRKPWKQIQDYANLTHKNAAREYQAEIKKRQELEQQQQDQLSEQSLAAQDQEFKQNLKAQDQQAKIAMNAQQSAQRGEIQSRQADADIEIKRRKARAEIQNKDRMTQAKVTPVADQSLDELRMNLDTINGSTPSPYDIEGIKRV